MKFILSGFEKQEELCDQLVTILPVLKEQLCLHGATSSASCKGLSLNFPKIMKTVRSFEDIYGRLDFDNLDSWLEQIKQTIRHHKETLQQNMQLMTDLGLDLNALSDWDWKTGNPETLVEKASRNAPRHKLMRSFYGPNWSSHAYTFNVLYGLTKLLSKKQLPMKIFKPKINTIATEIFDLWETLRRLDSQGRVRSFQAQWSQLHPEARNRWLQQFRELHRRPDLAICILAQNSKTASAQEPFLSPLLNIEDLAQANVLPEFLQNRSAIHPKAFLFADSRFVALGYWHCFFKKIEVEGRISFFSDTDANASNSPYGIQFELDTVKNLHMTNPVTGYYSLMAQKMTYEFLVSCLSAPIEPCVEPTAGPRRDSPNQLLPILSLSAQQQYGRPDHIDWRNLKNISKASADEALDDLWQLRNDAEYWNMRFTDMKKKTLPFLSAVFGRIDVLHTIYRKLDSCRTDQQTSYGDDLSVIQVPSDDAQIKDAIYMHSMFRSILDEMLSSIQNNEWLRRDRENRTLHYLFNLMAENHPTIRLMGFGPMLRTIDRELSDGSDQEALPLPIAQALHDMSVVSACTQATAKHYNLISSIDDNYARLALDATLEWQKRERPWLFPISGFLNKIKSREYEFNRQARIDSVSLVDRHRRFWNSIDDCMLLWDNTNPIVHMIFSQAPVPRASTSKPASIMVEAGWGSPDASSRPTATQKRKSRRQKPSKISESSSLAAVWSTEDEPRIRPNVYITEESDIEYWSRFREKGQESFDTWVTFLSHIGFSWERSLGSIHTFQLEGPEGDAHKILYHGPHGRNGEKLPHDLARRKWVNRLKRHFNVIVSEKGVSV
ncbi:uncharacterized protein N7473_011126 [Penicillium subrubescens]|uniref:Uncharacterized protein n=1 Tax=Penicillium subrubescens TaxID=1316194 RepID=A0A1Q5UCV0_9EURO|nr:uncharacterized protein N7473_011126 [Penicillium subrubescens]KAJ5882692.1 hypothetical protein N7473_011126 [Penicillium subrubescens]OKP10293.1 hypothetical protein PENSUB_4289 [Penicillium subrubescens]